MALYRISVGETRIVEMLYFIEADSPEEAEEKAERGDTEREEFVRDLDITNREILTGPEREA
jgi:hypothetical protein